MSVYAQMAERVALAVKWDEHQNEEQAAERSDAAGDAMRAFLAEIGIKTEMHHTCCDDESRLETCPQCDCTGDEFCSWRVTPKGAFDWAAFRVAMNARFGGLEWRDVLGWD